ncbi:methylisocitrate lyase [Alicyclobacillus mali]|uniref:Methylisocitrate lyase n=1 Tax=Alicyclobacillus mali (ex Roth et al. 2021) TaxID=1123961 RepID=A0ABS0F2V5_9BACL|nr:methylisocitrate lyase [Alicyclobacillus mali (ex Roth et al. 2021)]MBF8377622.1 methylisocitrate lyase [Alicyclobacillus mali (ex Roth et al. 2021)]MCL6489931.1 methylisocitrate lyase [Alicyclobacillus mali (ex Roth et al. 2021)]
MAWLVEEQPSQEELAKRFLERIRERRILKIPGAHDGLTARIAKQAGFEAIYLSGAAYTASRGLPDLGIVYSNEVAERAADLVRASGLPVLVDIDTGYGGVLNVARTAKEMVEARVAAVQIEDQVMPKKCGHLNGKKLVEPSEMVEKIRMLKTVAPTLVVVARSDAKSVEGLEALVERANRYVAAGADAVFPEALTTEEEFRYVAERVPVPLLANMTEFGKTPYYTADQFESWGYRMVIYPVTSVRVAAKAIERVFEAIQREGTQKSFLSEMQSREELYKTIRYFDYEALDEHIAKTVLEDSMKRADG